MTATLVSPSRGNVGFGLAITVIAIVTAVAGAVVAIGAFTAGAEEADHHHTELGEPIETSFGSVTFEHVATIGGLTPEELGGVTHGIQNLVLTGQAQVEVSVLVENRAGHPIDVVPDQFNLAVQGVDGVVAMAGSTIVPMSLAPGGTVEATLTYVVPQSGTAMTVTYADPGGEVISLAAGSLDLVAAPSDAHAH
jgi:hypothetical protein